MPTTTIMKRSLFLLVISILTLNRCNEKSENVIDSPLSIFADSLFNIHVDSAHIAGASVIVMQNGETLLNKSYGFASLELSTPMPPNASFEIGSVTKQFTAAAILKLLDEGKLSLEDEFTRYIEFDTKGRKITINQLLNHTSGIASYTELPEFWNISIHQYERDSLVRLVEQKEFLFEPGESLIYNNSGYFFLGLIIEKLSEKKYEEYLSEQFFEPLGMNDTYYCSTTKVVKNKAYGYSFSLDGLQQKSYLDHTWPYSAGSLCSTTADLLKWMRAVHQGKVLNEELYSLLITPDMLNDGTPVRYAKGLANYKNFGYDVIAHGGGINGFLSDTRYFPDNDLYIICLVNTMGPNGASFFAEQLTWELLDKRDYETVTMEENLQAIAGKYTGQVRGRKISVEIDVFQDAITQLTVGEDKADTINVYIGNNSWMDGNNVITIKNGELRADQVYGYYILKKE